jgi:hypothetical protein
MKMLTAEQRAKLLENSRNFDQDHAPVVKFFNPAGAATWLISEMDEDGRMFGLCDLGMGCPELGYVMLEELETTKCAFALKIERDRHWTATKPMSAYAEAASKAGRIVDNL